jgi:hypothetical protein
VRAGKLALTRPPDSNDPAHSGNILARILALL